MLCKKTKEKVTVALSGDGADEIFSGYNKHAAWYKMDHSPGFGKCLNVIYPWVKKMPQSRSGKIGNALRQVVRYVESSRLSPQEKYWFMASCATQATVDDLLVKSAESNDQKDTWLKGLSSYTDMNDMLRMDTNFVLPHDMLKKVDAMSMANSLEVRVPFLDHELLDFVFRLPEHMKINGSLRKRILQDAYRDVLPAELYNRPKKGFEMPLLDWLKTSLKVELDVHLFDRDKIKAEGYFQWSEIERLQKQLFSNNPGDSHARVWGLYIFQKWKKKYL
jgi:asparagine synthase (glutamine-hydrolysing)